MLEPWIETFSGKKFYFLDPTPEMIDIEDIAHSLSRQCRFSGHLSKFMSVAEHSVNVSKLSFDQLSGLMHDASEAYLLDIPSPVKQYLANYKELENRIMDAIATRYNFQWPLPPDVKDADAAQLVIEAKYLLPSKGADWAYMYEVALEGIKPECWSPDRAKRKFLNQFERVISAQYGDLAVA